MALAANRRLSPIPQEAAAIPASASGPSLAMTTIPSLDAGDLVERRQNRGEPVTPVLMAS